MWVRVMGWMLMDDEPPRPSVGSLLRSVGVRLVGAVTTADAGTRDGVVVVEDSGSPDPGPDLYAVTGIASDAQDVWSRTKRWGPDEHAGAEFVLSVGADRFQVQFDGHASEVVPAARVTVTGGLELVGEYEWESFGLRDTRADWLVTKVVALPDGDISVELAHPQGEQA